MSHAPWTPHRVPESHCPDCGYLMDRSGTDDGSSPEPGDVSICIRCAAILCFTGNLCLCRATKAEIAKMRRDPVWWADIQHTRAAIRQIRVGMN